MRFALHSCRALAKIFHISFSWMCELLFKFDELSNANKGHIRISRCACVSGRERARKTRISFKRQCVMILSFYTHPSKCVFWNVERGRPGFQLEEPLSNRSLSLVFTTNKKKVTDIKKRSTWTCSERGPFFISPQHSSAAGGVQQAADSRQEQEDEREAGIKSACWKKQDGHKRWTKLQWGLFLSKANGNISTQHREGNGGSIITAEQTELAAVGERRWDVHAGPA